MNINQFSLMREKKWNIYNEKFIKTIYVLFWFCFEIVAKWCQPVELLFYNVAHVSLSSSRCSTNVNLL